MVAIVLSVAGFFAGMGVFALLWPERVVAFFGTPGLSVDGKNEVRAVYGGFGLAVAGALAAAPLAPDWGPGILLATSLALFGMAGGRLISRAIDGAAGPYPWLFFVVEVGLGGALLLALVKGSS